MDLVQQGIFIKNIILRFGSWLLSHPLKIIIHYYIELTRLTNLLSENISVFFHVTKHCFCYLRCEARIL